MGVHSLAFPVFFALLAGSCFAQVTGRITGSVTDSSGAAIPNATVNLLLTGGAKPVLTTVTTPEGLYSFTNVRPESYDMTVESSGFLKYSLRGVKVEPARETALPKVQLEVSAVTQSVDVIADVQTVQTSNSEVATTDFTNDADGNGEKLKWGKRKAEISAFCFLFSAWD